MLFLNVVIKKSVKSDQFNKIREFINDNTSCLNYLTLIRLNKTIAYITFVLKEFYEFLQLKTEDGEFIITIKEIKSNFDENVLKLENLNLLI